MERRLFLKNTGLWMASATSFGTGLEQAASRSLDPTAPEQTPRKILVTGAGGTVGTALCNELRKKYFLRVLDVRPIPPAPNCEIMQGSVSDWATVKRAVEGMDAVAHLAIHNPSQARTQPYYQYIQADVDVGVKGTDMLLYAAKEAGVNRFVYTSSLNVYSAKYPKAGEFLRDSDEVLSAEHYGTIKWLAEELCRHYGQKQGVSTVVLRLNSVTSWQRWVADGKDLKTPDYACTRVHIDDVVRAIGLALVKPGIQWGRCLISGANPEKRFDTSNAQALIGFIAEYGFAPGKMYRNGNLIEP
jgi:UDP-glucose 4-epimerase